MDLSIIIINYNTFDITCDCIKSVYKYTSGLEFQIILIDNHSNDRNPAEFLKLFPNIILFENKENIGFGQANNIGMEISNGEYILLLNSDTVIIDDSIQKCYEFLIAADKKVGMIGCKLIDENGNLQISTFENPKYPLFTYFFMNNPITGKIINKLRKGINTQSFIKVNEVGGISGAFMMFRRDVYTSTKGFDPDFFMYSEETEWIRERVSKKYKILFYPEAKIIHLGGKSGPKGIMFKQSLLSFGLFWYKKGYFQYFSFVVISIINIFCGILVSWLMKRNTRKNYHFYCRSFISLIPDFLFTITQYPRSFGARNEGLKIKELS